MQRSEPGMETKEVQLDAVRIDSFLKQEYPDKNRIAMWIDVEGHAYEVLEGLSKVKDSIYLIHVEVETQEVWPGQKVESDILALVKNMGFTPVARGANQIQHDLILVKESWYYANKSWMLALLYIAKWVGPLFTRMLMAMK